MHWRRLQIYIAGAVSAMIFVAIAVRANETVFAAQTATDDLEQQIKNKQDVIKQLEFQIENYKQSISVKQKEASTLKNQVYVVDAGIKKAELDLELVSAQIAQLELEIKILSTDINSKNERISHEQDLLSGLMRAIHTEDAKDYLYIFFAEPSFSGFFNQLFYLSELNARLGTSVRVIEEARDEMQEQYDISERKQKLLKDLQVSLIQKRAVLDEQKKTKEYLLRETKSSEAKYKILLAQLRAEYAKTDQEVIELNRRLRDKLIARGDIQENGMLILSWPVTPSKGISTYFYDPSYPFRYLFEHPGIDMPIPTGTPVAAAAPGYVAWVRTTRFYGNNIMIAHRDNINTIYAHFSRFSVKEGDYVKRGDIIGLSGGALGTPGAGLSTGPHVHFEVRENGLPVDPLQYLTK